MDVTAHYSPKWRLRIHGQIMFRVVDEGASAHSIGQVGGLLIFAMFPVVRATWSPSVSCLQQGRICRSTRWFGRDPFWSPRWRLGSSSLAIGLGTLWLDWSPQYKLQGLRLAL